MIGKSVWFGLALIIGAAVTGLDAQAADPTIRFGVIGSSGQADLPTAIQRYGLDKKYGIAIEIVDYATPGQQYTLLRSNAVDIAGGNFVDLLRQRRAGAAIKAIHGFEGYGNPIVTKPDSGISSFSDLKGRKVGNFGTTFLDWLIVRAAGRKIYNIDIEKEATLVQGAPPLLNQLLARGEVDAALQFTPNTVTPVLRGQQKVVTDVRALMDQAGFDANSFYLHWIIREAWVDANPKLAVALSEMLNEAYAKLRTDDELWPTLTAKIGITEPALVAAYRDMKRSRQNPPYRPDLLPKTQALVDALVSISGEQAVGVKEIETAAFLFPLAR